MYLYIRITWYHSIPVQKINKKRSPLFWLVAHYAAKHRWIFRLSGQSRFVLHMEVASSYSTKRSHNPGELDLKFFSYHLPLGPVMLSERQDSRQFDEWRWEQLGLQTNSSFSHSKKETITWTSASKWLLTLGIPTFLNRASSQSTACPQNLILHNSVNGKAVRVFMFKLNIRTRT